MSIRTEYTDGLLFFVYGGRNVYLYAALTHSSIMFTYKQDAHSSYVLFVQSEVNICDGLWHYLTFVKVCTDVFGIVALYRNILFLLNNLYSLNVEFIKIKRLPKIVVYFVLLLCSDLKFFGKISVLININACNFIILHRPNCYLALNVFS